MVVAHALLGPLLASNGRCWKDSGVAYAAWHIVLMACCLTRHVNPQRTFRGYNARKKLRQWVVHRLETTIKLQSLVRMRLGRVWLKREKRFIDSAAIDVQRIWRGYVTLLLAPHMPTLLFLYCCLPKLQTKEAPFSCLLS